MGFSVMKLAATAALALWALSAAQAAAEDCDKLVAAELNGEAQEAIQRIEVSLDFSPDDQGVIDDLKQRFKEASDLHTAAIDRNNDDDLKAACKAYQDIYDEAKALAQ